jgi:hypothetical protein
MICSPRKKSRVPAVLALVAVLGPLAGCDSPGIMPPIARRRTTDPVSKVRPGVKVSKADGHSATPGESRTLIPARGRMPD